ncbi:MAG: M28 family peptidase [Methylotenera sp.]
MKKGIVIVAALLTMPLAVTAWIQQPFNHEIGELKFAGLSKADPASLKKDVEKLYGEFGNRHFDDVTTLDLAANYIQNEFSKVSSRTRLQSYQVDSEMFSNVIARFGPTNGNPIIIGAHYDAEAETAGADDNASGVAGLLELARLFAKNPPSVPVELVAYTLEEPPNFRTESMGSRQHAAQLVNDGITPRLVIVLEMIGYFNDAPNSQEYPIGALKWLYPNTGDFIAVVGNLANPGDTKLVKMIMKSTNPNLAVESISAPSALTGIDFSDHASYWLHDMPAVMITDTSFYRNANYHKATDTPDTLNYQRMAQVVEGVFAVVNHFIPEPI